MITVQSKGVREIYDKFEYIQSRIARRGVQEGLMELAIQVRRNARMKMANVGGEQRRKTIIGVINKNHVIVAVNVVYAAYNEEGVRRDGTRRIKRRTAPGQDHALKKATLEANLDVVVDWVNYELKQALK